MKSGASRAELYRDLDRVRVPTGTVDESFA